MALRRRFKLKLLYKIVLMAIVYSINLSIKKYKKYTIIMLWQPKRVKYTINIRLLFKIQ